MIREVGKGLYVKEVLGKGVEMIRGKYRRGE